MEGRACTWLSDMKGNPYKIAWIHNDVNLFNIGIKEKEIRKSYNLVDKIVVVSKLECPSNVLTCSIGTPLLNKVVANERRNL